MSLVAIEGRLTRINISQSYGDTPTAILSDRSEGHGPEIPLSDWRTWVADGIDQVHQGVLRFTGPEITAYEWAAQYVTEHRYRSKRIATVTPARQGRTLTLP